ncbi:hypothetical protein Droror1_Dr00005610 [Drosera rotundifolia]
MVTEAEIVKRLHEILSSSDLNTTTPGSVRRQLEDHFGVDLSDRKPFISQQIDEYLIQCNIIDNNPRAQGPDEEVEGDAGEEGKEDSEESGGEGIEDGDDDHEEKDDCKPRTKDDGPEKRKRGGGFTKLCSLSPQLQEFVGVPELARTEVVKKLWAYIREKNLQDPGNRRNINCDEKLSALFPVHSIDMFQMNKALSKHIWPLEAKDVSVNSSQKDKQLKRSKEDVDSPERNVKRQKGGILAALRLSDALVRFLGTGETQLPRCDVVKRMWEYIKQNNLQDPSDKRVIICDEKLKELFDVESFKGFTVTKLLGDHFIK